MEWPDEFKPVLPYAITKSKSTLLPTLGQHLLLENPLLESPNFSDCNSNPPGTKFSIGHRVLLTSFIQDISALALIDQGHISTSVTISPSHCAYFTCRIDLNAGLS